jgi:hypothetical protein
VFCGTKENETVDEWRTLIPSGGSTWQRTPLGEEGFFHLHVSFLTLSPIRGKWESANACDINRPTSCVSVLTV